MINISALYDVVTWATQPANVWLFHLPKQEWESPRDVMIGGATSAKVGLQLIAPTSDAGRRSSSLADYPLILSVARSHYTHLYRSVTWFLYHGQLWHIFALWQQLPRIAVNECLFSNFSVLWNWNICRMRRLHVLKQFCIDKIVAS